MKKLISFLIALTITITGYAQDGYSSASVSMNRANAVLTADMVKIDEYVNYHRHSIPLPKNNEEIALSTDYHTLPNGNIAFQVGIATQKLLDFTTMPQINVSLVIDKSGSMQSDNRLEKVKKALLKFVAGLRDEDYISLITYDTDVFVVLSTTKVGDIENLESILDSISPSGSTNLHAGLMQGYSELTNNYLLEGTNKVILLTDGICNVGITDTEEIVQQSGAYNTAGIDVSTIGVGSNVNYSLLQQIAQQGKGANHFIGEAEEDFTKVFEHELESLIAPIAKDAVVEITYPKNVKLKTVYGYQPSYTSNKITIPLKNLNSGLTQVILCEFEPLGTKNCSLDVALTSYSIRNKKSVSQEVQANLKNTYQSDDVLKNYTIAALATSLKKMAGAISSQNYIAGLNILNLSLQTLKNAFPNLRDKDILRIKDIVEKNKQSLETLVQHTNLAKQTE